MEGERHKESAGPGARSESSSGGAKRHKWKVGKWESGLDSTVISQSELTTLIL